MHNSIVCSGDETKCISVAGCQLFQKLMRENLGGRENTGEYLGYLGSQQIFGGGGRVQEGKFLSTLTLKAEVQSTQTEIG